MNRIKQLRGSTPQKIFAAKIGPHLDAPMISRFEQGAINPIPNDAQRIAESLGTSVAALWDAADLDYGITAVSTQDAPQTIAKRTDKRKYNFRISCRLPDEFGSELKGYIERDGFTTAQSFMSWWLGVYVKGKRKAASVGADAAGKGKHI